MSRGGLDTTREHAVVIGASMGGLAAAAALARHYERVTILERDPLADAPCHRRGVPQSKHAHGLQPGGLRALDELLPDLAISDALEGATPIGELQPSHFPASRRRRYDKLRSFPAGLLALGDSIASFNPMYGQGTSVAALEAVALRDSLARGPLDARTFFARAHRIEDVAWKISTGGDLRYEEVEGKRTPDMKIMNWYLDRLTAAARTDAVLARRFLLVAGFVERPETFFKPSVIWRVLTGARARRQQAPVVLAGATTSRQPDPTAVTGTAA